MKKSIFVTAFAAAMILVASAQTKEKPPKPPAPPKPPVEQVKDVAPPPPPPTEPPPPPAPPEPPMAPVPPQDGQLSEDYEAFLKRNPSVESLGWNFKNEVIIRLKSGQEEHYRLDNETSRKAAATKYGELPAAPPPPPPPAPPAPPRPRRSVTLS